MTESHILRYENARTKRFQPNRRLEALIEQLRECLEPAQRATNVQFTRPSLPLIGIVGCPRSGTTFVTQLLAATGGFAYPTNLLSRFAYAPYVGALIQQLLFNQDFDIGNEFGDIRKSRGYASDIGKTAGALGINEFFHFWRRFFPNHDPGHLEPELLEQVDITNMCRELASIEAVLDKPFISKAMMFQYNLDYFMQKLPELTVIHVKRDPLYVMQSVYLARKRYYGNHEIWWSVKPKEYPTLKNEDPATQVAGQVYYTDRAIETQLQAASGERKLTVNYEDVCRDPRGFIEDICLLAGCDNRKMGFEAIQESYRCSNTNKLTQDEICELEARYKVFSTCGDE